MGNRLYISNGYAGIVIADHTNKLLPTFVINRNFDNGVNWSGSVNTYKGSAWSCVYFEATIAAQLRKFLLTGTASPSPEGELLSGPPFPIMELFEVTSETLPTRLQRVEIRGNIEDWDSLWSVAFGLVKQYVHPANSRRYFVHIDGYQEGNNRIDDIPTQYWEVACEWIPSLSCGTEIPLFNFDPEYFSIWEWKPENIATFPVEGGGVVGGKPQPLVKRANQQSWSQPALRHISVPSIGHIFILETRFAVIPTQEFTQLAGSHLLYAYHANPADATQVIGPVTVNRTDRNNLPFSLAGVNATFDVDSQFYIHFAHANGPGVYREYKLSLGDIGSGQNGYKFIDPIPKITIQFPREFSGTIQKKMMNYCVVHADYVYIFYMASLDTYPGQLTPCITVIDATNKNSPAHKWDVSFPTLVDPADKMSTVWDGRMQPIRDDDYLYVAAGNNGVVILDIACIAKKHPDLIGSFSSFGNIVYPAGHASQGQTVQPPTAMAKQATYVVTNSVQGSTTDCNPVPQEQPEVESLSVLTDYTSEEWHGNLWRGLNLTTGELLRLSLDRFSDKNFSARVTSKNLDSGVVNVELFPHKPEKVGAWASDSEADWGPSATGASMEKTGFWYADNQVEASWNDRLIFSLDNGLTWFTVSYAATVADSMTILLNYIKSALNTKVVEASGGTKTITLVERTEPDKKIRITISSGTIMFTFSSSSSTPGITKDIFERNSRFGQTVLGATPGLTYNAQVVTFSNPVLYSFDATYTGSLDLSRWG